MIDGQNYHVNLKGRKWQLRLRLEVVTEFSNTITRNESEHESCQCKLGYNFPRLPKDGIVLWNYYYRDHDEAVTEVIMMSNKANYSCS